MPLVRFPTPTGLVYTIDLSKIADRANPRTVEAPINTGSAYPEPVTIDWGDGSAPEILSSGQWPTHDYSDATGDIFRITIRSNTGRFPIINYSHSYDSWNNTDPVCNVTLAVISVDHFAGEMNKGYGMSQLLSHLFRCCDNIKYTDTRLPCAPNWTNSADSAFNRAPLAQPIGSFCFDFTPYITVFQGAFRNTHVYGDIPKGLLDNCSSITNISSLLNGCINLTGEPYRFWKSDGTLDTDKFPDLTLASAAYAGCSAALRAQVPTAYGGTMTVS